jgi:hypothetical protein
MIEKVKGAISLPSGELFLDGDLEIEEQPVLSDEEFIEQARNLRETIKKAQQRVIHILLDGDSVHGPTGPIVDSTLAERDEESDARD